MIKVGARQNYRAASPLRRLSTDNDQARPGAARDSRRFVRSRAGDAGSADRSRVRHALDRFPHSVQHISVTNRQRRIPIASDARPRHTSHGFLGRLRTPASRVRRAAIIGPASANLHKSCHSGQVEDSEHRAAGA
jgi:hypothetical protein